MPDVAVKANIHVAYVYCNRLLKMPKYCSAIFPITFIIEFKNPAFVFDKHCAGILLYCLISQVAWHKMPERGWVNVLIKVCVKFCSGARILILFRDYFAEVFPLLIGELGYCSGAAHFYEVTEFRDVYRGLQ